MANYTDLATGIIIVWILLLFDHNILGVFLHMLLPSATPILLPNQLIHKTLFNLDKFLKGAAELYIKI